MLTCVVYEYIILICDLCTMKFFPENGVKQTQKKLKEVQNFNRS